MMRGPAQEKPLEFTLRKRGICEKDIGWVLSKLDSQEYFLDKCHYIACITSNKSENHAKEVFINGYFSLNMKGIKSESKINDLFQECIDKKKTWIILEKKFGVTCIKIPDTKFNSDRYLFVCGANKKCPDITNDNSLAFFPANELQDQKRQNPLEMTSLRLA